MRTVYKVLAYLVAAEVMVQAMVMVFAVAGLGIWVDNGGVFDKSLMESESSPFPEAVGFMLHGMNGMMVIPVLALILLIASFFTRLPGAVKWAAVVLLLVIAQIMLGMFGHVVAALGALHGLNALLLFSAAIYTARRVRKAAQQPTMEAEQQLATPA